VLVDCDRGQVDCESASFRLRLPLLTTVVRLKARVWKLSESALSGLKVVYLEHKLIWSSVPGAVWKRARFLKAKAFWKVSLSESFQTHECRGSERFRFQRASLKARSLFESESALSLKAKRSESESQRVSLKACSESLAFRKRARRKRWKRVGRRAFRLRLQQNQAHSKD
jgi:hypothetical protein